MPMAEVETDSVESTGQQETRPTRGLHLTAKQAFIMIAVALALVLVGLIVYLVWFLGRPEVLSDLPPVNGIQPVWQIYGPGEGDTPLFDRPMGVAVGEGNRIYVTDSGNNRVCVFDAQGRFIESFGTFGVAKPAVGAGSSYAPGSLNYPVGIDTDDEGNVYVASFYNDSIEVFTADGDPLRRFPDPTKPVGKGSSGYGGQGIAVTDVAVSGDTIYATDAYQVFAFTLEGELIDQWGLPGTEPRSLDHPNGLAVSEDGKTVYVSDSNHARVTAFTPDGEVLWQVGEIPEGMSDTSDRDIELPRGLTVLPDGSILVTDAFAFELVLLSADGEVVARFGERGVEPGQMNFSNDVAVLRGFVVIADKENGRVQLVRLVR